MWVYFWALYSVSLIYVSVLCQNHTVLITVALYYSLKIHFAINTMLIQHCKSTIPQLDFLKSLKKDEVITLGPNSV